LGGANFFLMRGLDPRIQYKWKCGLDRRIKSGHEENK
jgi:hypothetical protein